MTDNEARLLCAEAQKGCTWSQNRVVSDHRRLIELVAFDWVRVYAGAAKNFHIDIDDLIQNLSLIILAEVIPTFRTDGPVPFRSYARRKMNAGLWRDLKFHIRQKNLLDRATPYLREQYIENSRGPDPLELCEHRQVPAIVNAVLTTAQLDEKLSSQQVEVMRLVAAGYSGKSIADAFGIPKNKVYFLISGARAELRGYFYDHE